MLELLSISAKELCRILSSDKSKLNHFEIAIREALENENTVDELRVMKEEACVSNTLSAVPISTTGRQQKRI